jgi:hypothetical protein
MNTEIVKQFFPKYVKEVEQGICPICHNKVDRKKFKDKLSKVEFSISGMCQECQDKMFK